MGYEGIKPSFSVIVQCKTKLVEMFDDIDVSLGFLVDKSINIIVGNNREKNSEKWQGADVVLGTVPACWGGYPFSVKGSDQFV